MVAQRTTWPWVAAESGHCGHTERIDQRRAAAAKIATIGIFMAVTFHA